MRYVRRPGPFVGLGFGVGLGLGFGPELGPGWDCGGVGEGEAEVGVEGVVGVDVARVGIGDEFESVDEVSDGDREDKPEEEFREEAFVLVRRSYGGWASHLIPNQLLCFFLRSFHFSQNPDLSFYIKI